MWLWQCTLLLGVLAHVSTGSKSGKAIVTKDLIIIPRCHDSKVCLYTDDHLSVFDPSAHHCQCHEAVQKVLKECCPNNRNNDRDQITSGTPHQQYPQPSSPYNQPRLSGLYDSHITQRGVPSNPNQFQPSDPKTRGLLPNPQSSDENQRRQAGPTNVPYSGRPQGPINLSNQFEPNNQQRLSGLPYMQRQVPSSGPSGVTQPPQGLSFDPSGRQSQQLREQPHALTLQNPQTLNQNNHNRGNAGASQGSYFGTPQDQNLSPRSLDRNNQQRTSGQLSRPNSQRGGNCGRPTGSSHQPHSSDPSYQQRIRSPDIDRHNQAVLGSNNGPDSGRPHSQSLDPNTQQSSSGRGPWNSLNSPAQQPRSQSYDPKNPQRSHDSEHLPLLYPSQTSDPSHQRRISGPAQTGGPSNRLGVQSLQPQSFDPTNRELPVTVNQQHPQSQNKKNHYGGNSGPTSGPNGVSPHTYGSNNPQRSSNYPNTQTCQSGPGNGPTGITQQPGSSDPTNHYHVSRPLPQGFIPKTSNINQHGGNRRPDHKPDNERPQGSDKYPRTYVPNNQQQLSDPNNSLNTVRRSNPNRMTQQPQSSDPSNDRRANNIRGSAQPQNEPTHRNDQNIGNPRFTGMPSSRKNQGSDQRPRSYDSRNQQERPSNGPLHPMNQQNRQYSDPSRQNRGNSDANEPHIGRPQGFNQPQSQIPRNQQERSPTGAKNDGPTQLCCADGKKPLLGYFSGHFEVCGGQLRWILDSVQTPKSNRLVSFSKH
uniref:Translation initiation factor IF-2 n=1 Tax=Lygus hesperus TaxID=30085 RepID=A0A146LGD6_LYGHE